MNNVEYVMDKLSLYTEIPVMCLDEKDNIRSCNEEFFAGEAFYEENRDLLQKMLEQSSRQEEPVVCLEESFYFYILLTGQEKYLLGPVILGEVPRRDIWSYRNIRKYVVCQDMLNGTDFRHFVAKLSLVYLAVYHRQMDEVRLLEENGISADQWKVSEYDNLMFQFSQSEKKRNEGAFRMEQEWLAWVKDGADEEQAVLGFNDGMIGEMAKSSLKQQEYTCVCTITLLIRAAVEAGVPSGEAYSLSDMYLQKLEKCKDQMAVQNLLNNVNETFIACIRRVKDQSNKPSYITTCKDYIAQHRTDDIRVSDLADCVGMSHSYLSRKFKEEEGITIQQYILKERIKAAANLIKYSDASLSEIAEYLHFTSQSHMGSHFKQEYGMTPNEYRKKYKIVEFS